MAVVEGPSTSFLMLLPSADLPSFPPIHSPPCPEDEKQQGNHQGRFTSREWEVARHPFTSCTCVGSPAQFLDPQSYP